MIARRQGSLLLVHTAITQVIVFVLRPSIAYRAIELDMPAAWLGVLSACFALVPLMLAVPSGQFADRVGEKRVMLAGSAMFCLAGVSLVVAGGVAGLVAGSVLLGTGQLLAVVGQQSLVAKTAGAGRYDTAFGHYTFAASLGQTLGPAMIVLFGGKDTIPETSRIFIGSTLLIVALLGCTFLMRDAAPRRRDAAIDGGGVRTLLRIPGLPRAVVTSGVVLAAMDITLVYLPALGVERGMAAGVIGVLLAVRAASSMMSRLFLGRLSRWIGRRRLLLGSVHLAAVALAFAPVPQSLWLLGVVVMLLGMGLGVGPPLTMSWVAESTPRALRGRAMALRITGNRIGQVVLPSSIGLIAAGLGAAGVLWMTSAALVAVGFVARGFGEPVDTSWAERTSPRDSRVNG